MKAIEINNTTVQIEFDSQEQRKSLASLVSYKVPGSEFSPLVIDNKWDGTKCFLTKTNKIKKGIFKSLFPTHHLVYDTQFKDISFNDIPLFKNNPTVEQREYQLQAINAILRNKIGLCNAAMGLGKCLGKDTPVVMADTSIKKVQDIVPGDKLLGPDGKIRNVLSVTSGQDTLYKIIPVKGDSYITNSVHLLSLKLTSGVTHNFVLADGTKINKNETGTLFIEAETLYNSSSSKSALKAWRPDAVSFDNETPTAALKIPPYILGIWLGDGASGQPELTGIDHEVIDEFSAYAQQIGCKIKNIQGNGRCPTYFLSKDTAKTNLLMDGLRHYKLLQNKHIPVEYKMASLSDRLELLAGLLDTDGSLTDNVFDFVQKKKSLCEDVVSLCRSLGLAAYLKECTKTIKAIGFSGQYWRVCISGDTSRIPTRIARKKATARLQKKNVLRTSISIESAGYGDYYGFEIDGDKQFLLGDWQVTHNTLVAAGVCSYHLKQNSTNKILFIVYDTNILNQTIQKLKAYKLNVTQFGNGIKDLSGDIVVATIHSLNRIKNPKASLKAITFVIADEAHHGKSKSSRSIITKLSACQYFIGLTATPYTEHTIETAELTSILGPVIFTYGFTDGVKAKKINPVKAFFLDIPPDLDIKERVFASKKYKYIWDTAIQCNVTRNNIISDILYYCVSLLDTTNLVLVDRTEHGTELYNNMKAKPNLKITTMFGNDGILLREVKKQDLMDDTLNTLISTVIKEGVDFKVSPVVAINASGRKGFVNLIQFLGRITRPNEKFKTFRVYYDFIDRYHPYLRAHSLKRIKACEDFGIDVVICHSMKELIVETIKYYKQCCKKI